MEFSVEELAQQVEGRVEGDPTRRVEGLASVASAGPADLTYVVGSRYARFLADSRAGAMLVPDDLDVEPNGATLIRVDEPGAGLLAPARSLPPAAAAAPPACIRRPWSAETSSSERASASVPTR